MTKKTISLFLLFLTNANASELDLGIGLSGLSYPDYVGSNNQNNLLIPYPYISYRSEKLKIDNEGVQHKLYSTNGFILKLSLSGTLPIKSSGVREGMDDLNAAGEIGPSLLYNVYRHNAFYIKAELPIRAVLSTDLKSIDYHGHIYEFKTTFGLKNKKGDLFEIETGPVWANSKYHNYLYGVESKFTTKSRPKYESKGGYSGYKTSIGFSKSFDSFEVGAFARHYTINGSSFSKSPLIEKNSALYGGFFIAYIFDKTFSNKVKEWVEK